MRDKKKKGSRDTYLLTECVIVSLFPPSGLFFQSELMRHPEATSCLCKCETPRVKMIRPWVRCAPEGICLACILFGLFLPYGLINNARRLETQLQ